MENSSESTPPASPVPTVGRLMGLDYGTRRIGIAVSTAEQNIASPLENYTRQRVEADARRLAALAEEYEVVGLVVGLPVHMSGDEGGKAREAREFGTWVSKLTGLPVCYWDERYTSAMADIYLQNFGLGPKKRKAHIDKLAAQLMLQSFLNSDDRTRTPHAIPTGED